MTLSTTTEKYLCLEKNRSAVILNSVRVFDSIDKLQDHIESLYTAARATIDSGQRYSGFYPSCWYIYAASSDSAPRLRTDLMIELNLRGPEGETFSLNKMQELGITA